MVKFNELGPYLREEKCGQTLFFFDCLAVCTNVKPAPENREFWGWWLILDASEDAFCYHYAFGLFNKEGHWTPLSIKKSGAKQDAERSLQVFFPRLQALMDELNVPLRPVAGFDNKLIA